MKMTKNGWMLTSTPLVWWLGRKMAEKKANKAAEVLDNLKKLHGLKEEGVITEEEFSEIKAKQTKQL